MLPNHIDVHILDHMHVPYTWPLSCHETLWCGKQNAWGHLLLFASSEGYPAMWWSVLSVGPHNTWEHQLLEEDMNIRSTSLTNSFYQKCAWEKEAFSLVSLKDLCSFTLNVPASFRFHSTSQELSMNVRLSLLAKSCMKTCQMESIKSIGYDIPPSPSYKNKVPCRKFPLELDAIMLWYQETWESNANSVMFL